MIKTKPVFFPDPERHRISMSDDCKDFISKLLDKSDKTRLGVNGLNEVLEHPWLASIDKDILFTKSDTTYARAFESPESVAAFDLAFTNQEAKIKELDPT